MTNKDRIDLLFDVKNNPKLYAALQTLASVFGRYLPSVTGRSVVRVSFKNGKYYDEGGAGEYKAAKATYQEKNGYNPVWIGAFGVEPVKLPKIGSYDVIAKPEHLEVGCQQIPWSVVENCLANRPKDS